MSIIPASRLSRSDLGRLSNNLGRLKRRLTRPTHSFRRRLVNAVNRSLAIVDERIGDLDPVGPVMPAGGVRGY